MQERCTNTPPSSASAAPQVCDIIYECSSDCEHGSACSLRLAQRGLPRDLEVFMVEGKGFGVRCFHKVCCLSPVWSNTLLHSTEPPGSGLRSLAPWGGAPCRP